MCAVCIMFVHTQVYLHLEECSSTPRSKAKHRENAELQLQACKERATENQVNIILSKYCSFILLILIKLFYLRFYRFQ